MAPEGNNESKDQYGGASTVNDDETKATLQYLMLQQQQPQRSNHRHEVTINEKRAPTEDSVRLLMEMEEAASRNIVDRIIIDDNTVNMSAVTLKRVDIDDAFQIQWKVNMNGNDLNGSIIVKNKPDKFEVIKSVYEVLSKEITKKLLDKFVGPDIYGLTRI